MYKQLQSQLDEMEKRVQDSLVLLEQQKSELITGIDKANKGKREAEDKVSVVLFFNITLDDKNGVFSE